MGLVLLFIAALSIVGMRVCYCFSTLLSFATPTDANSIPSRIVEYRTSEDAQNAIQTLSNQDLMGRLVYVREVRRLFLDFSPTSCILTLCSRTASPRLGSEAPPAVVAAAAAVLPIEAAIVPTFLFRMYVLTSSNPGRNSISDWFYV